MSDNTDYIPYSDEWKKEMMKWSKSDLIDFLRKQLRKIKELEDVKPFKRCGQGENTRNCKSSDECGYNEIYEGIAKIKH